MRKLKYQKEILVTKEHAIIFQNIILLILEVSSFKYSNLI